jgi:arsenate reductase
MKEVEIDISNQKSRAIDEKFLPQIDVIVTLCGHAEALCPMTPPGIKRIHMPVDDPVGTIGTEKEIMDAFRKARDKIKENIRKLIRETG